MRMVSRSSARARCVARLGLRLVVRSALSIALGLLAMTVATPPPPAGAHGARPRTSALAFREGAQDRSIALGTTFGLLVTEDGGARWGWICEELIGYRGGDMPRVAWLSDGTLVVASIRGLALSRDGGCSWTRSQTLGEHQVPFLAAPSPGGRLLYALAREAGSANALYRSLDGGQTFVRTGVEHTSLTGLAVSPARPERVYVTAWGGSEEILLLRSDDGGATHRRLAHPGGIGPPSLLGASPVDADLLLSWIATQTGYAVYRSADGGERWEIALETEVVPRELGFSPDGATVYLATGGGLYQSSDGGRSFARPFTRHARTCPTVRGEALYLCGDPSEEDWQLARGPSRQGPFELLLPSLLAIPGPRACPAGAPLEAACAEPWRALKMEAAFSPPDGGAGRPREDGGAAPDAAEDAARDAAAPAMAEDTSASPAPGANGPLDAPARGSDRPGTDAGAGAPAEAPPANVSKGSGCAVGRSDAGSPPKAAGALVGLVLLAALGRARRGDRGRA